MSAFLIVFALSATVLAGAIFGFFYAWLCSCMWGLDATEPKTAIRAMKSINDAVQNPVFAPAFFGTPVALAITSALAYADGSGGGWFAAAGMVYVIGGMGVTILGNVPLNQSLAGQDIPTDPAEAAIIWSGYSRQWQYFNRLRTLASGLALVLTSAGLLAL